MDWASNERDFSPQIGRCGGNGKTLPPRRTVGDVADRINRLMRWTSGHEDALTEKRTMVDVGKIRLRCARRSARNGGWRTPCSQRSVESLSQHRANLFCDGRWFGQSAGAKFAACHCAFVGCHDVHTIGAQLRQISLSCPMVPHAHIHGGNRKHGLVSGQQDRGGEVVGNSCRHFCDDIGGCGADNNQIGLTAQLDMPNLAFFL